MPTQVIKATWPLVYETLLPSSDKLGYNQEYQLCPLLCHKVRLFSEMALAQNTGY